MLCDADFGLRQATVWFSATFGVEATASARMTKLIVAVSRGLGITMFLIMRFVLPVMVCFGLSMLVLSMPVRRAANSGGPGGPPCPHYSMGSHPLRVAFACGVMAV